MTRYTAEHLIDFAQNLLQASGLAADRARVIAELLVEGDLLGHTTHGLAQLPAYLQAIKDGTMTVSGDPEIVADRGAAMTWDGRRLPGVWLVAHAMDVAAARVAQYGTATVVIRRSHHIACLAAFLPRAIERGLMILLMSSDPAFAPVAPAGGKTGLTTPNPIAVGIPTSGDPILIDISSAITTMGLAGRLAAAGQSFDHDWLIDAEGKPSRDPRVLSADPPGWFLPTGGIDHGHKGFGLALMIEALTGGLAGYGRADGETRWGATVFLQLLDPAAFGGLDAYTRQTGWLAERARATPPIDPARPVRLPGERGLALRAEQLARGVALHEAIMPALLRWAEELGVSAPAAA